MILKNEKGEIYSPDKIFGIDLYADSCHSLKSF